LGHLPLGLRETLVVLMRRVILWAAPRGTLRKHYDFDALAIHEGASEAQI